MRFAARFGFTGRIRPASSRAPRRSRIPAEQPVAIVADRFALINASTMCDGSLKYL
jgi:hypothetical protein